MSEPLRTRVALGTDHAGFAFKERVKVWLREQGFEPVDFGTHDERACDYPDFVLPAARAVASGDCAWGVVFGGSGNGEAIAANKIRGVRAALGLTVELATLGRRHNDANVLALGQRVTPADQLPAILEAWRSTSFEGGRHTTRLAKLADLGSPAGS